MPIIAWNETRKVEARAMAILMPFLKHRSHDGQVVLMNKGTLARYFQETYGDAVFNSDKDTMWSVEIKAEEKHTGNLFLETFSNRNLDVKDNHIKFGTNVGWLLKLKSDLLMYYFLDTGDLYIFNLFKLQRWAFGYKDQYKEYRAKIYDHRELLQQKHSQCNDTLGRVVPLSILKSEVGFKHLNLSKSMGVAV